MRVARATAVFAPAVYKAAIDMIRESQETSTAPHDPTAEHKHTDTSTSTDTGTSTGTSAGTSMSITHATSSGARVHAIDIDDYGCDDAG